MIEQSESDINPVLIESPADAVRRAARQDGTSRRLFRLTVDHTRMPGHVAWTIDQNHLPPESQNRLQRWAAHYPKLFTRLQLRYAQHDFAVGARTDARAGGATANLNDAAAAILARTFAQIEKALIQRMLDDVPDGSEEKTMIFEARLVPDLRRIHCEVSLIAKDHAPRFRFSNRPLISDDYWTPE
jgi:hypothetical protein